MINTNSITNAIYTLISSDAVVVSCGVHVDLYGTSPEGKYGRTPWVGVVPGNTGMGVEYEPRRANIHNPWQAQLTIPLQFVATAQDKINGMQKLDGLQSVIFSAINCAEAGQRTLMGTVDMVIGFSVAPLDREELEGLFFMRQVNIIAEALT